MGKRSIHRYRGRGPARPPAQTWRTFLATHRPQIWSADLVTVRTLTWRTLYVVLFITHARRQLVHVHGTGSRATCCASGTRPKVPMVGTSSGGPGAWASGPYLVQCGRSGPMWLRSELPDPAERVPRPPHRSPRAAPACHPARVRRPVQCRPASSNSRSGATGTGSPRPNRPDPLTPDSGRTPPCL